MIGRCLDRLRFPSGSGSGEGERSVRGQKRTVVGSSWRQATGGKGPNKHSLKWIPLATDTGNQGLFTMPVHIFPQEICIRVCSYIPSQCRGKPNTEGKMKHLFLIPERVEGTRHYERLGAGEIFLEDFFSPIRGLNSEAKNVSFLGHSQSVMIL